MPAFLYRLRDDRIAWTQRTLGRLGLARRRGRHDPVKQRLDEILDVSLSRDGIRLYPVVRRDSWPGRTRPDGANGWAAHQGALGRLEPRTVHANSAAAVSVYGR